MTFEAHGFDWDIGNRRKCQKHGVSIPEIEAMFKNDPFVAPDLKHSRAEERFIAIGTTDEGRRVYVAFTLRVRDGQQRIRPVSARYMHAREIASYEKNNEEESA
ncbi:MAG: BrnT family toxin [Candidatus Korobacteraceae bacterium]